MNENKNIIGILPINKPESWTSFDVVAKLRGILKIKRLGHAGTLDPMATGVLPIFIGKAARACDILPIDEKIYTAGFQLGITTDTQDSTGEILSKNDMAISYEALKKVCGDFIGDIMQVPPMYSAVSVGGKRLYELAREGKTIEREARPRRVNFIEILSYDEEIRQGKISVSVSKGTYIRTLINDIGEKLGCGGIMTSLVRTRSAGFNLKNCYTLEQVQQYADRGEIEQIILPIESAFDSVYKEIHLNKRCTPLYKNGVKLRLEQVGIDKSKLIEDEIFCVTDSENNFLGLAKTDINQNQLKIYKNFF